VPLSSLVPKRALHVSSRCLAEPASVSSAADRAAQSSPQPFPSSDEQSFAALREWLSTECRAFPVSSSAVRVLSSPAEFYDTLLDLSSRAEKRVLLSSLYLGTGPHEQALVAALHKRMQQQSGLRVDVLLDYLRATRLVGEQDNSLTTLQPLMRQTQGQPEQQSSAPSSPAPLSPPPFALHLLHLPRPSVPHQISPLRSWFEQRYFRGAKTREVVGVHHMKFYVFDDAVILSGANLSDTYFTNRQDRYIMIRDAKLAAFYAQLLERLTALPISRTVTDDAPRSQLLSLPSPGSVDHAEDDADTRWSKRVQLGQQLVALFDPRQHPAARPAQTHAHTASTTSEENDTLVFPTLQFVGSWHCGAHGQLLRHRIHDLSDTLSSCVVVLFFC
jgi:phosphatidylserine/phosphatidylglycerophosphate/cardiolipin synthase-like enzyme